MTHAAPDSPATPDISVVIPTHARDHLLTEAVASVLAQTVRPREVLVCDDTASPATRAVVEDWAARTDGLVRYVDKAERGEPLAPKKSPGSSPKLDEKASKLLEDDLRERPFATLRGRCDYMEVETGLCVSRSTMCRAIARIGTSRKKGDG